MGVTDWAWFQHVSGIGANEVNFWQPNAGSRFSAVERGAPFLFKTKYDHGNKIVGGGFFSGHVKLPVQLAWEFFYQANGAPSFEVLFHRIATYRRERSTFTPASMIGCLIVSDVHYFSAGAERPAPPDWSANLVSGRSYDLEERPGGTYVESVFAELLSEGRTYEATSAAPEWGPTVVPGPVLSGSRRVPIRVGQPAFKALVHDAYQRRCAITGDRIVPVLEAAHIRPVASQGENRVDNGLLLRSDVHTLFDRGYLGVHPDRLTLMVSRRLRTEWGNGEEFYAIADAKTQIRVPERPADRPNQDFLTWHADEVFTA